MIPSRRSCGLALGIALAVAAPSRAAEEVPDRAEVRAKIDAMIKERQAAKGKASLGLLRDAIRLSISYGAPAYNNGDHDGCHRFYEKTCRSLVEAFGRPEEKGPAAGAPPHPETASPAARAALDGLAAALKRAEAYASADRKAWALRLAFDEVVLSCEMEGAHAKELVGLGSQYFKRSQFEEAEEAYASACRILEELSGDALPEVDLGCRIAPLFLAQAQLAQKRFREAAATAVKGVKAVPECPSAEVRWADLHPSPQEFEGVLDDLQKAAADAPLDADLRFLFGYECYFADRKKKAEEQFRQVEKIAPGHAGAALFLKRLDAGKDEDGPPDGKPRKPPPKEPEVPLDGV